MLGGTDQVLPLGGPFVTPPLPKAPLQGYPDAAKKEDTASAVGNKDIGQKPALLVPEVLPNPQLNRVQNTVDDKISDFAVLNYVYTDLGFGESIDFNDYVPTKLLTLHGSLLKALPFWREIESSQFILQTIELGYKLPFLSIPNSCFLTNNRSAKDNSFFVESAIAELLVNNLVEEVFLPQLSLTLVSTNRSGKCRLILDLREVNKHLDYLPVKYEDLKIIKQYLEPNSYMFSFDLKSGYHHGEICSPYCK